MTRGQGQGWHGAPAARPVGRDRRGLLASTALTPTLLAALALAPVQAAAQCVVTGSNAVCTGNLNGGVLFRDPAAPLFQDVRNLAVNSLTFDLRGVNNPGAGLVRRGADGATRQAPGVAGPAITLNVATGDFRAFSISGPVAGTVYALSRGGNGADFLSGGAGNGGRGGIVEVETSGRIVWNRGPGAAVAGLSRGGNGGSSGSTRGDGGAGNSVDIVNNALVFANGAGAIGVLASSRGGRGAAGSGGGDGRPAGAGGLAEIQNLRAITTSGAGGIAALAQSIGGGGGNGGDETGIIGGGGQGGEGGRGSLALVNNEATGGITTEGVAGHGLMALSLGGGGGTAGAGGVIVGLGSPGGPGGAGGGAQVINRARVSTAADLAVGLFAQSVGGGGGDGGASAALVALGGAGSVASAGGNVHARHYGVLATAGDLAQGMVAQSIGGGGGRGGTAGGVVSFGGTGGGGGAGGEARGSITGSITTAGEGAAGVLIQSIGGGGGAGGGASAGGALFSVALGGDGGDGGAGGAAHLNSNPAFLVAGATPNVTTTGALSAGIVVQSIGGGGGDSGRAVTGGGGLLSIDMAIGGSGGGGGAGGAVTSNYNGRITTGGALANGLVLQSIGGGGGNAGQVTAGNASGLISAAISLGGSGGLGGAGGSVTHSGAARITTAGDGAVALLAQSIGGGGGNGGNAFGGSGALGFSAPVLIGGSGGLGGIGGAVTVANAAAIATSGVFAHGIQAQSIGGGGGNGGQATGGGLGLVGGVSVSLGGSGAAGGFAGAVQVAVPVLPGNPAAPIIATSGASAHAVLAQSIGGGGGTGGLAGSVATSAVGSLSWSAGGSGGFGAFGGPVSVDLAGAVATSGALGYGVLAQSIGGGGGNGGHAISAAAGAVGAISVALGGSGGSGGLGGVVSVTGGGAVVTTGAAAIGIAAQSIGGGGGAGNYAGGGAASSNAVNVTVGGSGGTGGHGGLATVNRSGTVSTGFLIGDQRGGGQATAVLVQSIGGGGGVGGYSRGGVASVSPVPGFAVNVGLGGSGGAGGDGGIATGTIGGALTTFGELAYGVAVQSIGAGGGLAGGVAGVTVSNGVPVQVSMGGSGGAGGKGGAATANVTARITTDGALAHAVLVQSIGAGGGAGGVTSSWLVGGTGTSLAFGGTGGASGLGGTATANVDAVLITRGSQAAGIHAQSIGGGGGTGGAATTNSIAPSVPLAFGGRGGASGDGGAVNITQAGLILTQGGLAPAISAQSIGGGGGSGGASASSATFDDQNDSSVALALSFGGNGVAASAGGAVNIVSAGGLQTQGGLSHGILAQSIGGGGGSGGMSAAAAEAAYAFSLSLGGSGGGGGSGGAVQVARGFAGITPVVGHDTLRPLADYGLGADGPTLRTAGAGAHGVIAQSIGGGGGDSQADLSIFFAVTTEGGTRQLEGSWRVGSVAAGGNGGSVTVRMADRLATGSAAPPPGPDVTSTHRLARATGISPEGGFARGVLAQSIGRGGGTGGGPNLVALAGGSRVNSLELDAGAFDPPGTVGLAPGAAAGPVSVTFAGAIDTAGLGSDALVAQSIGGGGGAVSTAGRGEGNARTPTVVEARLGSSNIGGALAVGTAVTFQGSAATGGAAARGLVAQTIANGGGIATIGLAAILGDRDGAQDARLALGATSGVAVSAGPASVRLLQAAGETGAVLTAGRESHAVVAQSIAGGGGLGDMSLAVLIGRHERQQHDVLIALGGAVGGLPSAATVELAGLVGTLGAGALGAVAQSVGGGGGLAGGGIGVLLDVADTTPRGVRQDTRLGGSGGGAGQLASLTSAARIETQGAGAHAAVAQSIGGGGGIATGALAVAIGRAEGTPATTRPAAHRIEQASTLGALGGVANGGSAVLGSAGQVITTGDHALGLVAQSIGGGGGIAGSGRIDPVGPFDDTAVAAFLLNRSIDPADRAPLLPSHVVQLGARPGAGGNGGMATLTNAAGVQTSGAGAIALLAQSVGAGGGIAALLGAAAEGSIALGGLASAGGAGGAVTVQHASGQTARSFGALAHGLVAQSIGGGGGIASGGLGSVALGTNGGFGGGGDSVNVEVSGILRTGGALAAGGIAQSIGGGGGLVSAADLGGRAEPGGRSVRLGARSGVQGSGGSVSFAHRGVTITDGLAAPGALAQSIGAGGGFAQLIVPPGADEAARLANRPRIALGADAAAQGAGGGVALEQRGFIGTAGTGAHGAVAQSVGGGGGLAIATGLFGLGAQGNAGGASGIAILTSLGGETRTAGSDAFGLAAQSVAGGGGLATAVLQPGTPLGFAPVLEARLGATSTLANSAGTARIILDEFAFTPGVPVGSVVATTGARSIGVLAQSVGGGGGVSGGEISAQGFLILGSARRGSGAAGLAELRLRSASVAVATTGDDAPGLVAQSVAGGGGIATGTLGPMRIGGEGTAGAAGAAQLGLLGSIATTGRDSAAAIVQSIAGGGGIAFSSGLAATLGGAGGGNAAAGAVEARVNAALAAGGLRSAGLIAQSIAGGGGILARFGAAGATLGASLLRYDTVLPAFAVSGPAGAVTVCNAPIAGGITGTPCARLAAEAITGPTTAGALFATGEGGVALVAQSIAGGGGFAGQGAGPVVLGSSAPGAAGLVRVLTPGQLAALGADGAAAVIQSIGGGGGLVLAGGAATLGGSTNPAFQQGEAANAGAVAAQFDQAVDASGARSLGLVAQSIGGGGGAVLRADGPATLGGTRLGAGGAVNLSISSTVAAGAAAVVAQSIGGGGGLVRQANGVAQLGRPGAVGSTGGTVTVQLSGTLATAGAQAPGVLAQSIGAGGGAVLGGVTQASMGGSGGSAGRVEVIADNAAAIATLGAGSVGILAQSLGAGGGVVGGLTGNSTLGGGTALAGVGGRVDVDSKAPITTAGAAAHGILAQSGGGGGGIVIGPAAPTGAHGTSAGLGGAGAVTVTNGAAISVAGAGAHGIVAQSAAGGAVFRGEGRAMPGSAGRGAAGSGGGGGTPGNIAIINRAAIGATGAGGIGIWAQSLGAAAATSGTITLTLDADSAVLGGAGGAGLRLESRNRTIAVTNDGSIGTVQGVEGRAILVEGNSPLTLTNRGTITGSLDTVGGGITNSGAGLINAGARIALGTGTLTNNAGFAVFGRGRIGTTELTGNFTQGAAGVMHVDVAGLSPSGIAVDRLNVSGSATLAGQLRPELIPGTVIQPGTHQATFLKATGGATTNALTLVAPPTPNATWSLIRPNGAAGQEADLRVTLTTMGFASMQTPNQRSVARGLESAAIANPAGFAPIASGVYGATDGAAYGASLTSMGGDGGFTGLFAAQGAMRQFMAGMTARMDLLQRADGFGMAAPASFLPFSLAAAMEGEHGTGGEATLLGMNSLADQVAGPARFWAMPIGFGSGLDARSGFGTQVESRVGGFLIGFDQVVAPRLTIGMAGGYSDGGYAAGSLVGSGSMTGGHGGAYALWQDGPLYVSGQLGYAMHSAQQSRLIAVPGASDVARSDTRYENASAQLELGWRFALHQDFALTPFAGVGVNAWRRDAMNESTLGTSAGGLALRQGAASDVTLPLSLGLRADTAWRLDNGLRLTAFARGAWVREEGGGSASTAAFALAPDQTFRIEGPAMSRDRLAFNLGIQLEPHERLGFGFGVLGDVSDRSQSVAAFGRVMLRW